MKRRTVSARILALGLAVLGGGYAFGCGSNRPPSVGDSTAPGLQPIVSGPCSLEGESRPCRRLISEHSGVVTCSYGTQECAGGVWTGCGGSSQSIATFQKGTQTTALAPQFLPALKVVRLPSAASPATLSPPGVVQFTSESRPAAEVTQ